MLIFSLKDKQQTLKGFKNVWRAMPLCIMWNLWYERNKRVFDGVDCPTFVIKEHILQFLYDRMSAQGGIPLMSLVDFSVSSLCDLYLKWDCTHPVCQPLFLIQ